MLSNDFSWIKCNYRHKRSPFFKARPPTVQSANDKEDDKNGVLALLRRQPSLANLGRYYSMDPQYNFSSLLVPGPPSMDSVEIPFLTAVGLVVSGITWYVAGDHTVYKNEVMISLTEFLTEYLRRVDKLYVVNGDYIKAVFKPITSQALEGEITARFLKVCTDFVQWAVGPLTRAGSACTESPGAFGPGRMHHFIDRVKPVRVRRTLYLKLARLLKSDVVDTNSVLFKLDDVSRIHSLLKQNIGGRDRDLPKIYYPNNVVDRIDQLRRILPIFMIGMMTLICVSGHIDSNELNKKKDLMSRNIEKNLMDSDHHNGFNRNPGGAAKWMRDNSLGQPRQNDMMPHNQSSVVRPFAKTDSSEIPDVKFKDVAGLQEAKIEIQEFVEFLKNPTKFTGLGAIIPKGALLIGPPGTGKTLLAKAVAGEAGVPFFSTSGSDFIEMFVGVGASRIRDLFDKARKSAPAIIFIDEIDTIGRHRQNSSNGNGGGGGVDERESTLNALLVELDGFNPSTNVITLAGTNRGEVLDPALTRPGRFDRQITLSKPSIGERIAIFEIYMKPIKLAVKHPTREQDITEFAKRLAALTPGFTGAEIKSVCNEAAIYAARRDSCNVQLSDFETAVERLVGGLKHTGDVLNEDLRKHVAIHEAGHAVCGWYLKETDPVMKLSIVPRANGALGYTQSIPDDLLLKKRESLLDRICMLLGGRCAELLFCSTITTGASDDLERAARLCEAYVKLYGFCDKSSGYYRSYADILSHQNWPGHNAQGSYSKKTLTTIDESIDNVLRTEWERCKKLLTEKKSEVMNLAKELTDHETINYGDIKRILGPGNKVMTKNHRAFLDVSS